LNSVKVDTEDVEVARIMQKYDLEIPVVDDGTISRRASPLMIWM
jgi:Mg/Co/Ni transporter MgtE